MRTYEVRILGQRYKVRSDEKEEYILSLADYVNGQLAEVQKGSRAVASHNAAVLTALNIADSLFKAREREEKLSREVTGRVKKLLKLIRAGSR
ncbi:MAG: cell division protein ZapA [Deltaproteobacteria bacterium]|nr:cell division protein ZapA [Deltaproteobacteria bacterium]